MGFDTPPTSNYDRLMWYLWVIDKIMQNHGYKEYLAVADLHITYFPLALAVRKPEWYWWMKSKWRRLKTRIWR